MYDFGPSADQAPELHRRRRAEAAHGPRRRRRRPLVIRPTPDRVRAVAVRLVRQGAADAAGVIPIPVLVAALRQEVACARATAYRGVADALAAGVLGRGE